MTNRNLVTWVVVVCIISFGTLAAVLSVGWTPLLGLDLKGGLSITYSPYIPGHKGPVSAQSISTAIDIIRNRINGLGVAQPNVETQGSNIVVQIPGIKDPSKAESLIGTTAQLYFRPILCQVAPYSPPKLKKGQAPPPIPTTPPACPPYTTASYQPGPNGIGANPPPFTSDSTSSLYPTTPVGQDNPNSKVVENLVGLSGARLELGPAQLSGTYVVKPVAALQSGQWVVNFSLTSAGQVKFNQIAAAQYHKQFAIELDGQVISDPLMNAQNFTGSVQITGLSETQAQNLAIELSYGALPVSLKQLTVETVSPTLGSSSLTAGLTAGIIGLILVMIYTIFYYRGLGVVVILGLATTGAFLYGFICLLSQSIGTTLDLSGVTGLIVSVGITVDSYVVYFERLKDEIRSGRTLKASVDKAFKRAFKTVLFADAVSLIGAAVLWIFSIGAVKGFAFFLGISTMLDIVTAYSFTRPLVILLGRTKFFTRMPVIGIARGVLAEGAAV